MAPEQLSFIRFFLLYVSSVKILGNAAYNERDKIHVFMELLLLWWEVDNAQISRDIEWSMMISAVEKTREEWKGEYVSL